MLRILFVDDEKRVLDGLRDSLRRKRKQWDMTFARGGPAGLERLQAGETYDVIVSDMRMPDVDGATLLDYARRHHPDVVRIMLTGHAEKVTSLRAVSVAHQLLAKPCDRTKLENVLLRALKLKELLEDERVRAIVGRLDTLPTVPRVYAALSEALHSDRASARDVAKIVADDMTIAARLLQLVNSAFFRVGRPISTVEDAIIYLGLKTVRDLVLSVELFNVGAGPRMVGIDELRKHSLITARLAPQLLTRKKDQDAAFTAGLVHNIGQVVLYRDPKGRRLQLRARHTREPLHELEEAAGCAPHAAVGAYLLGLWGLPYEIVEAVAHHHRPAGTGESSFGVLGAVHVASALAHEALCPAPRSRWLDEDYLAGVGIGKTNLAEWRSLIGSSLRNAGESAA